MSKFNVGDKVVYLRHVGEVGTRYYKSDLLTFNIGQGYTIREIYNEGRVLYF